MALTEQQQPSDLAERQGQCPVRMMDGKVCSRPVHTAPPGADKFPVCLMHSRDSNKGDWEFQNEFHRILEAAGDGIADFTEFVFRRSNYGQRTFKAECVFSRAFFMQGAHFNGATFTQVAHFDEARFTLRADFLGATFAQRADFGNAIFTQRAEFHEAVFASEADFGAATFMERASFTRDAFGQEAVFSFVLFRHRADFMWATFAQATYFAHATFEAGAEFRETQFRRDETRDPGPTFYLAKFEEPREVTFYKTYLGQALFYDCDISGVIFSAVEWRKRPGSGKRMLFEEIVALEEGDDLGPPEGSADERNYTLVAEIYQRLKKYYDDRRDYWTAGDFHYGEMEMKRQATPPAGWLMRNLEKRKMTGAAAAVRQVKRAWHRSLGLAAWYKYASQYGESYVRPFLLLAFVVVLFGVLLPALGLQSSRGDSAATRVTDFEAASPPQVLTYWNSTQRLALVGHGLIASVSIASFQRGLTYAPTYPWGRLVEIFELILTSTLLALLLLAVRRQFRRSGARAGIPGQCCVYCELLTEDESTANRKG